MTDFPALKDALGKLDTARKSLRDVFAEAGAEMDMDKVKSLHGDSKTKIDWVRGKNEEIDTLKSEVDGLKALQKAADEAGNYEETKDERGGDDREFKLGAREFGDLVVKSEAFKRVGRKSTLDIELKTLFQRTAGWDPEDVRSGRLELTPQRPAVHVVNYIPTGSITQSDYKYMEETTFTTDSGETPALAKFVSEGSTFAEAQLALTERSKPVEKVTVWLPMTDEQLEDEPGARDYVQQRLLYMLNARVDMAALRGSGSTPQILGTENVSSIQTQAKGADTLLDASYKLFTSIRSDGFAEPSVAFVAPSKWQEVMLLKTADGQYIWGHPSGVGPAIWGVPVVPTTAVTSTKLVTGDYATYSMLFVRRGVDIQITNTHSTDFINGKQAIRADARLVLVHFRPKAFGTVTGL
jgi:HK97 family phage major capsid protein